METVWNLGIQGLPEYKRVETAKKTAARFKSIHYAYVFRELMKRRLVPKDELETGLMKLPGDGKATLVNMHVGGLISYFTDEEADGASVQKAFLTEDGKARLRTYESLLDACSERFLAPLTQEEKFQLGSILAKLLEGEPGLPNEEM